MHRSNNVTLKGLKIEGCSRSSHWGVIDIQGNTGIVLDGIECIRNSNSGGPSCISGWKVDIMIRNMHASGNTGKRGGALIFTYSNVWIENGIFAGNYASLSGGVAFFANSYVTIMHTSLIYNHAYEMGGALLIQVWFPSIV